jgi:DNA-binding IclR family transcriptional regulator
LTRELELIRRRGYAEDNQEFIVGISCLAVPVRNSSASVVAGLGVMAPTIDFPLAEARRHIAEIQACADAISAEAGWDGSTSAIAPKTKPGRGRGPA